jgi:hypothetical protein
MSTLTNMGSEIIAAYYDCFFNKTEQYILNPRLRKQATNSDSTKAHGNLLL